MSSATLWQRKYSLIVGTQDIKGDPLTIDFTDLHFTFNTQGRVVGTTPGNCTIKMFNLSEKSYQAIQGGGSVVLACGYVELYSEIFRGAIKQIRRGREGTDTYVEMVCIDGYDTHYDSFISITVPRGSSVNNHIYQITGQSDVPPSNTQTIGVDDKTKSLRGTVYFGKMSKVLTKKVNSFSGDWRIENGVIKVVGIGEYEDSDILIVNQQTGMIGQPQQTDAGINVRILLNPFVKLNSKIQLNANSIQAQMLSANIAEVNMTSTINEDGLYKIIAIQHSGDTRGQEWYTNLITVNADSAGIENQSQLGVLQLPQTPSK